MDGVDVLVIGTDPPCPRCDLLTLRAQEATEGLTMPATFRHVVYFSDEAVAIGRAANRTLGTPTHVAEAAGIAMEWGRRDELVEERRKIMAEGSRPAELWTPALDAFLEPCRAAAEPAGFMMTPILVVNGKVKHHGSVPTVEEIRDWLLSK
jgi:hypothetical protein